MYQAQEIHECMWAPAFKKFVIQRRTDLWADDVVVGSRHGLTRERTDSFCLEKPRRTLQEADLQVGSGRMSRSSPHTRSGERGACEGLEVYVGVVWVLPECWGRRRWWWEMMWGGQGPSQAMLFGIGPEVTAEPLNLGIDGEIIKRRIRTCKCEEWSCSCWFGYCQAYLL